MQQMSELKFPCHDGLDDSEVDLNLLDLPTGLFTQPGPSVSFTEKMVTAQASECITISDDEGPECTHIPGKNKRPICTVESEKKTIFIDLEETDASVDLPEKLSTSSTHHKKQKFADTRMSKTNAHTTCEVASSISASSDQQKKTDLKELKREWLDKILNCSMSHLDDCINDDRLEDKEKLALLDKELLTIKKNLEIKNDILMFILDCKDRTTYFREKILRIQKKMSDGTNQKFRLKLVLQKVKARNPQQIVVKDETFDEPLTVKKINNQDLYDALVEGSYQGFEYAIQNDLVSDEEALLKIIQLHLFELEKLKEERNKELQLVKDTLNLQQAESVVNKSKAFNFFSKENSIDNEFKRITEEYDRFKRASDLLTTRLQRLLPV